MSQIARHDFEASGPPPEADYYEATALGAPFKVYLANGVEIKPDHTGKLMTSITDLPGLIAAVVRSRVMHSRKLSGKELRFIRSALCLKSKDLAAALELTPEHYSRCETGLKAMSTMTEKGYRCYVYLMSLMRDKDIQDAVRQQKGHSISPKEGKKVLAAFQKLFLEMKIRSVFPTGDDLAFTFWRQGCPENTTCGADDDAEWKSEVDQIAA